MTRIVLNRWDGGIVNDARFPNSQVSKMVKNFDALTNPWQLIPYRDSEDVTPSLASDDVDNTQNFAVALRTGTTYSLYALGYIVGTTRARIVYKNLTTGASDDLSDNGWVQAANGTSTTNAVDLDLFVPYKVSGTTYIFGALNGASIWRFDPTGGAFVDAHQALTYTTIATNGVVHSKDDILYIPYDNKIAKNNAGSWTPTALTLPAHLYITSISEYGDYLAIAAAPLSGVGSSRVFLWNRDDTLLTTSQSIDWGEGVVRIIEEVDGSLIGISVSGDAINQPSFRFDGRVVFRQLVGDSSYEFLKLVADVGGAASIRMSPQKQKINNRLHFMMTITKDGTIHSGVWSVGKSSSDSSYSLFMERTLDNDTVLTNHIPIGFFYVGDFLFQAFQNGSSVYKVNKTNDSASFTATSIQETTVNPGMPTENKPLKKQLVAVAVLNEDMPANGRIVLKYKVDGGSFTTILTNTTDDSVVQEAAKDASGNEFTSGREYEFRVESTGGAKITGLVYKYEILETII